MFTSINSTMITQNYDNIPSPTNYCGKINTQTLDAISVVR